MSPDDFWSASIDEAFRKYKGKIREWEFIRLNTWVIRTSMANIENAIPPEQLISLPFDDEGEDPIEFYRRMQEAGYFEKPI